MESFRRAEDTRVGGTVADAEDLRGAATAEIRNLIADVEDLVARIGDLQDEDVARVRAKVLRAVGAARESLADGAQTLRRQAELAVTTADDFVHEKPWQAVGIAALVGALVGILATRRS